MLEHGRLSKFTLHHGLVRRQILYSFGVNSMLLVCFSTLAHRILHDVCSYPHDRFERIYRELIHLSGVTRV